MGDETYKQGESSPAPDAVVGPTGDYPNGKVCESDEGGLNIGLAVDKEEGIVALKFGTPVLWIGLEKDD